MNAKLQRVVFMITILLHTAASGARFDCEYADSAVTTCCRKSKEFGMSSCNYDSAPRDLLFVFEIPTIRLDMGFFKYILDTNLIQGKYGILAPDSIDRHGVTRSILHAMSIGLMLSVVIHHALIAPKQQRRFIKCVTTAVTTAFLAYAPYFYFDMMDIQSSAIRNPFCLHIFVYFLRTVEAFFGHTPEGAKRSLLMYCIYFLSLVELVFDAKTSKPIKATRKDVIHSSWKVLYTLLISTVLISFLCHFEYMPFGQTKAGRFDQRATLLDYLDPRHLGNCFFICMWFQQTITYGEAFVGLIMHSLVGYKVAPIMDSPMLKTTSPSDFWTRRWNALIQHLLNRAIYKPTRRYCSAFASSFIVFAVSGLMHEWLVHAGFVYHRTNIPESALYKPSNIVLGSNLAFFTYSFVAVAIEKLLNRVTGMKAIRRILPRPIKTVLAFLTMGPFAFWFAGPYLNGRLFLDYEGLAFTIFKIE